MLTRIRRVRRDAPDAGISLTELIVTMTLMSIVGAMALGWMLGSSQATSRTTESGIDTARARTAVDTWSAMLGVMSPVVRTTPNGRQLSVTATTIAFRAQLDSKPSSCSTSACPTSAATPVTLGIDATGDLVQVITRTDNSLDRTILVPAASSPRPQKACLFSLYLADGSLLSSGAGVPKCSGLTAAGLASVARVDFAFTLMPQGDTAQTFGTSVALPGSGT